MKKVLIFKKSTTELFAFPADRLTGINKSADAVLDFWFDDQQSTAGKGAKMPLTVAVDDESSMKVYMERLANEIIYGKQPTIMIYDAVNDIGVCDAATMFSGYGTLVNHGT